MHNLGNGDEFKGAHDGGKVLLVGAAPSLNKIDLDQFNDIPSIAANRILLHNSFIPTYLVLCDRTPYIPEYQSGRIHEYVGRGGVALASNTIWDPSIKSRGMPVQKEPDFDYYWWRVGACSTTFNWKSMQNPLCSFGTIAGPMIQMAVIMGAKKIGMVGIDLMAPTTATSIHFYEEEVKGEGRRSEGVFRGPGGTLASARTTELLVAARRDLKAMGVALMNLSPIRNSPISGVFGNAQIEEFLA